LGKLPDKQKEAIILFEISGFKIAEIAEMQGATESAVKSQLKRGREKLTNILVEKKL
jgi:RNA polymerase sigma-70 factor (ECF subfamily)